MADFTTWTAALASLKNDIANRDFMLKAYTSPDGTQVTYRTLPEITGYLALVTDLANAESATSGAATRRCYVTTSGDTW